MMLLDDLAYFLFSSARPGTTKVWTPGDEMAKQAFRKIAAGYAFMAEDVLRPQYRRGDGWDRDWNNWPSCRTHPSNHCVKQPPCRSITKL
jgi:hypothetical protein